MTEMINSRLNNEDLQELQVFGSRGITGGVDSIGHDDAFKMKQHVLTDAHQANDDDFNSDYANTDDEDYTSMKQKANAARSQKTKSKKKRAAERKVVSQQEYDQDDPALSDNL